MANHEDDPLRYISYVTLQEGWAEIKGMFFGWLVLSVIFVIVGTLLNLELQKRGLLVHSQSLCGIFLVSPRSLG